MKKLAIGLSLLTSSYLGMLYAGDAQVAYRLGHYGVAGQQLQSLDPVNEYYLGKLRLYGYGLLKNNPLALQYFLAAANKGYLPAEQLMARYTLISMNNPAEALLWFKKAADQGDNTARMYCAAAYLFGYGAPKNPDLARKYYIDSAKSGDPLAQYTLGKYFLTSRDKASKKLGLLWLAKAANLGNAQAQDELGESELYSIDSTPDKPKAKEWFEKAAQQGLHLAMIHLGQLAISEKQYDTAKNWFLKANQPANIQAQLALAQLYLTPNTPSYNPNEGFSLTLKAAQDSAHSPEAAEQLSKLYADGTGTPQDKAAAELWSKQAISYRKDTPPTHPNTLINWLSEGKNDQIQQSPYSLTGIFSAWTNKETLSNNHYNQAPEMPTLTAGELFKPQFNLIQPNDIPLSDYFENIATYVSSPSPTLQDYPQYALHPTFELLRAHDSHVLNHDHDDAFIYPETLVEPQSDDEPNLFVLLELSPADQNRRQNYQKALLDLYNRAILGESAAQFNLGQLYQAGVAVAQNYEQAINYYELAAIQQEIRAEYNLGLLYLAGKSNPVDYKKGLDWMLDAAFKGNAYAQYALGSIYERGLNDASGKPLIEPNLDQSIAMYHLASANRFSQAEYQLASVLLKQNQSNLNVRAKNKRQHFIKQLYEEAYADGIAEAQLPLAFYQAMSKNPQDQRQAFATASSQAQADRPIAALLLAMLYDRGIGTPQNDVEAVQWYKQAINHPIAAFILGSYAASGVEGPQNKEKAKELLDLAAKKNLAYADYNLAILNYQNHEPFLAPLAKAQQEGNPTAGLLLADYYLNNAQSADNLTQAKSFYIHFAEKGDALAATKLGYLYENGIGTLPNTAEAEKWYRVAATQNQTNAQFLLGRLYQAGSLNGGANTDEAKKWYGAAAARGNTNAATALGFVQETHDEDYHQAALAYQQAADKQQPIALFNLGLIKEYGKGEPVNTAAARTLYEQAAKLGHAGAMTQLGHFYLNGINVKKDTGLAQLWFEKAAKIGSREALYQLGLINLNGVNQAKNDKLAATYFEQATRLGHELALMQFASMLQTGQGVAKDEARAMELYTQAANNHNSDAAIALARIAIQQGQTEQAQKWVDRAKQANNPQAEQLSEILKTTAQPKTSDAPKPNGATPAPSLSASSIEKAKS